MRLLGIIPLAAALCSIALPARSADKVVVIPLNSEKKLSNVVTVSARGGDFTNPVAAMNSITDASAAKPYLVYIGPGVYTLTQPLAMKPYVTIAGAGASATTLTGAISTGVESASTIVKGANNATLRDLTVTNTGGGTYSVAVYNYGCAPTIQNVTLNASGGMGNYTVENLSLASPVMTDVFVNASGGLTSTGIVNDTSGSDLTNVTVNASGGSSNYGIYAYLSSTTIRHSRISGATYSISAGGGGSTRVLQSSLTGSVAVSGSTLSCVNSDDGVATSLNAACQ